MLDNKRAIARIQQTHEHMRDYWRKVYRLRKIVAGDKDALISSAVGTNFDIGKDMSRRYRDNNPDILMQHFEEGRNNDLLNLLGVLVEQTCYYFPNIEGKGLTPHQQVVTSQYLEDRLTSCNATAHNKMALWDHLMGGCGDVYMPMEFGKPVVRWADQLDVKFDQTARLVCDVTWKSISVSQRLETWVQIFGSGPFKDYLAGRPNDAGQSGLDLPFELEFYYDIEHESKEKDWLGNYKVFIKTGENNYDDENIVYEGANPNFWDVQGERQPYLPFETIFYQTLPSVRLPMGAAEKALPAQVSVWRAARRIQDIIDASPPWTEGPAAADEKQVDLWRESMIKGLLLVSDEQLGKFKEHPSMPINQTDIEEMNRNQEAMKTQLGTANSLLGQPEKGVKFARDISAIQQQGSLTAGSISKDNSDLWGRMVPKFLGKGKLYDKKNFVARVEGIEMPFGPKTQAGPIGDYLVPMAKYIVSEDSMRFIPPQVKAAQAQAVLMESLQLAQMFPGAIAPAFRDFLVANGVQNVEERMKQAQPMMAGPGAPVGAGPGAALSPQLSSEVGTGA